MSTYLKRLQFYVKNAMGRTSNKPLLSEKSQDFLQVKENQDLFPSQFSNVPNVDTSTVNSSQKKFNLLTDSHPGLHDYD